MMAIAVCATVANLYYNQPLLPLMGFTIGIDKDNLGLIPFASQIGYAAAILLISPLGDVMRRKTLIALLSISLTLSLFGIYFSTTLWMLVLATFFVGISANITQQIIPFAASLSSAENKGKVISTIMMGLTLGILLSRTVSGTIAEIFDWKTVYLFAACLSIVIGVLLFIVLPNPKPSAKMNYPSLIISMFTLVKKQPLLREAAITGALWFAAFNALWATLALHVSNEPFSYNVQQAGLFGFIGMAGIVGAKMSGRLVNKMGAKLLISISLVLVLLGFVVMAIWGNSLCGLVIGILLLDIGVFGAQIPNQVRILSIDPQAQSRINAVYMLFYYLGASFGSAVGVKIMAESGWLGLTTMGIILALSALIFHQFKNRKPLTVKS
ncbi:permease [Thalassotalea profundi]|uniref:Permease n=2 Tax=Thalassotalea profundi TaxID=2036687 RepID=A0ABQ3IG88_9GAMM|nr:permease [Thalassotalea profundi]